MTDASLPVHACWSADHARAVLQTEALSNAGDVFLATHTPVERFSVDGMDATTVRRNTESGLLESLADPTRRHAFGVVQGEPGSGKSHLVRWLKASWPVNDGRDVPVLLQRADASLDGSLRGLGRAIPIEYRDVVGQIEVKQHASLAGRTRDFVSNLANALDPDYFEAQRPDVDFCRTYLPGDVLRMREATQAWPAPARIIELMAGAAGHRDSESASFTVYEVSDLVGHLQAMTRKANPRSWALLERMQRELDSIERFRGERVTSDRVLASHRAEVAITAQFTDALNDRRNHAIQNALGVSADKLKSIFLDLRRALGRDGRRLVLLLEDVTAWEGIDDGLIDVLVTDARTTEDLCDQVSIVGVTPHWYGKLAGNYRQRITHDVSLGQGDGGLQDVANFRAPDTRTRFVASYLRAARIGPDRIASWARDRAAGRDDAVPNLCEECPLGVRPGCHAAFGAIDGVGLYPFTDLAVQNFFAALNSQDGNQTWKTPRGMIQGVLVPTLTRPHSIDDGAYPPPEVDDHNGIDRDHTTLPGLAGNRLRAAAMRDADRERTRRLVSLWGDRTSTATTTTTDGSLAYAKVPKAIFDTFRIPWIGDDSGQPRTENEVEANVTEAPVMVSHEVAEAPRQPLPDLDHALRRPVRPPPAEPRPKEVGPRPAAPTRVTPRQVAGFLDEVEVFRRNQEIKTPQLWNSLAGDLISELDSARIDVDPETFRVLFKSDLVKVQGTVQVRVYHFVLPAEEWLLDALACYAEFRQNDHFNAKGPQDRDAIRRGIARGLRRMEVLARAHVKKRIPQTRDGEPWSVVATSTQVLAVRAWLRGAVSPDADLAEQWRAVLHEAADSKTDPRSRVDAWDTILRGTDRKHGEMRAALRGAVRLMQGDRGGDGLTDAADGVRALQALRTGFRLTSRPDDLGGLEREGLFEMPFSAAELTADKLTRLPYDEHERLGSRAKHIEADRRGDSVLDHLARLAEAIKAADMGMPVDRLPRGTVPWLAEYGKLLARPDLQTMVDGVEDALEALMEDFRGRSRIEILAKVAAVKAADVEVIEQVMERGEALLREVRTAVSDFVRANRPTGLGIEQIQARGTEIRSAARNAIREWGDHA